MKTKNELVKRAEMTGGGAGMLYIEEKEAGKGAGDVGIEGLTCGTVGLQISEWFEKSRPEECAYGRTGVLERVRGVRTKVKLMKLQTCEGQEE